MKVIVCSAWPYGYSVPHLGNIMSSLLSGDVFSRFYKKKGFDTLYVSGTDMHGTRAEFEAEKRGINVEELLKNNHELLKSLIEKFNINFDNYTNTESKTHKKFVTEIYEQIEKNGFISTKTEKRAFCENCQKFLADAFIEGACPKCGFEYAKGNQCDKCGALLEAEDLLEPTCRICEENKIIFKKTKHWFLDLDKLEPKLKEYVERHPEWTGNVKNFTKNFLAGGLKPRAITNDLKWGIPAPFEGTENKVIYVWAEAALGYVSATQEIRKDWQEFWFGSDVKQVYTIGKDNIPFHTIFFPAQLLGSSQNFHLPDQISATEYLNWEGGKKFSKSKNTGIFMDEALQILPIEHWRFYLLYDRPESKDTEFSWNEIEKTSNQILIGDFGNFINRTLTFLDKYFDKTVPKSNLSDRDREVMDEIHTTEDLYNEAMERGSIKDAVKAFVSLSKIGNIYFQEREPWKNELDRDRTLFVCVQLAKALAIFAYPIIPSVATKLWKILNLDSELSWKELEFEVKPGHTINKPEILVEKIDIKEVKEKYEALKK